MKQGGKQAQPYNLDPGFERAVVFLACTDPRFMARLAHEIQPDLLGQPECRLALTEAQGILRETGRGPSAYRVVIQRVARRREEGKVTHEEVLSVAGLADAFDEHPPDAAQHEPELTHIVRGRLRFAAAQAAVDEYGKPDWTGLERLLVRERALGRASAGIGVRGDLRGVLESASSLAKLKRVATGIDVLDDILDGGVPRGTLTCFMAGAGGGKSVTLSHIMTQMARRGMRTAYATLEIPVAHVMARFAACLSGVQIREFERGGGYAELERHWAQEKPVSPVVQAFTPLSTTVETLKEWVKQIEDEDGQALDGLFIDYLDKMSSNGKPDPKSSYQDQGNVAETMRVWVEERGYAGFTASQSRGRDDRKAKRLDIQDTADSSNKPRVVDHFITLNYDDETHEMTFFTAKNRYGEGRRDAGPVPTNFALGQVAPVSRGAPSLRIVPQDPSGDT